jgi:hypothetical protein
MVSLWGVDISGKIKTDGIFKVVFYMAHIVFKHGKLLS